MSVYFTGAARTWRKFFFRIERAGPTSAGRHFFAYRRPKKSPGFQLISTSPINALAHSILPNLRDHGDARKQVERGRRSVPGAEGQSSRAAV